MLKELVKRKVLYSAGPNPNMGALGGFSIGSKWQMLKPMDELVKDPVNEFAFHAPTIEVGELPTTPKHNYAKKINRSVFDGLNRMDAIQSLCLSFTCPRRPSDKWESVLCYVSVLATGKKYSAQESFCE